MRKLIREFNFAIFAVISFLILIGHLLFWAVLVSINYCAVMTFLPFGFPGLFLISFVISNIYLKRRYKYKKRFSYLSAITYGFLIFAICTLLYSEYNSYRWNRFYEITQTNQEVIKWDKPYDSLTISQVYLPFVYSDMYRYGIYDYSVKFTRELPDDIYGLTVDKYHTIYYNINVFLDGEQSLEKIQENNNCIRHEISHVVCSRLYPGCTYHGEKWIEVAKTMGVNTDMYENENKDSRKIMLYGNQ